MKKGYAFISESGNWLTVGYEDREVEAFGGMDYEVTYLLDPTNREKLRSALEREGMSGPAKEMILTRFGDRLDRESFSGYCQARGIEFKQSVWIS